MDEDDYAELAAAFEETDEGAKNLLVKDEDDVLRWMHITTATLEPHPISGDDSQSGWTAEIA